MVAAQDVIAWGANRAGCHTFTGPPYCADDESSAEDMRLAADLIDTDTGRTEP